MKKIAVAIGVAVVATCAFMISKFSPVGYSVTGYAAKNLCSGYFLSGFSGETIMQEALVNASPVLGRVSYTIHEQERRVDTSLYGLFHRRAVFPGDGTGCVLLTKGQKALERPVVEPVAGLDKSIAISSAAQSIEEKSQYSALLDDVFAEPETEEPRNTKAVVILHNGELVAERYAQGVDGTTPLIGWSMNKGIVGLVTGLMVGDGLIDLDAPAPVAVWHKNPGDPRASITLDQLMRMSSGLEFNEFYGADSDVTHMLSNASSAGEFAATFPLEAKPDTKWSYASGTTNIISMILKEASGGTLQSHYDYVHNRLFAPLGIKTIRLETDADGTFIGSSYGYAGAYDWARLGQFCLQNGSWNGDQLLAEDWISYVSTPTKTNPINSYGAHFWLNAEPSLEGHTRRWPSLPTDLFMMSGFQGQYVIVVPSAQLVVVKLGFTSDENAGIEALVAGAIQLTTAGS